MKRLMKKYLTIVTVAQSSSLALNTPNIMENAALPQSASTPSGSAYSVSSLPFNDNSLRSTSAPSQSTSFPPLAKNNRQCIELNPGNIDKTTRSGNFVVFYYNEECKSSKVFQQNVWNQLISSSRHQSVRFASFDCLKYSKSGICSNLSLPSVRFISDGNSLNTFEGPDFSLQKMKEFIKKNELTYVNGQRGMNGFNGLNTGQRSVDLTSQNFQTFISQESAIVFYFKPKCPLCEQFQATWEQLSQSQQFNGLRFGRLVCNDNKGLCNDAPQFPTLTVFSNGQKMETYHGKSYDSDSVAHFLSKFSSRNVNSNGNGGYGGYGGSTMITNNNINYKNNINNINYNKINNAVNNYENRFSSNHVVNISNNQNWNTQVNHFGSKYRPNSKDGRNRFTPQVDALTDNPPKRPFVGDLTDKYDQPKLVDALTDKPFGRPSSYGNEPSNSFYNDDYPTDGLFNDVPSRSGVNNNLASFPRNTNCPQASDNCQTNPCQKKFPHECNNDCCQICYIPCPPQVKDCPKKPCPPPPINIPDINSYNEDTSPPPVYNPPKIVRQPDSPKMVDTKVDTTQPEVDDITPPQSFKDVENRRSTTPSSFKDSYLPSSPIEDAEIPSYPDVDPYSSTSPPLKNVDTYSHRLTPFQSNKAVDAESERRTPYPDVTFPPRAPPPNFQDEFIPDVDADHEEIPLSPGNKVVPFIPSTTIPKVCNDCSNPCVEKHTCQSGNNCCCCCENSNLNINQFLKELTSNSQSNTINVINFNVNYGNCGNNC